MRTADQGLYQIFSKYHWNKEICWYSFIVDYFLCVFGASRSLISVLKILGGSNVLLFSESDVSPSLM